MNDVSASKALGAFTVWVSPESTTPPPGTLDTPFYSTVTRAERQRRALAEDAVGAEAIDARIDSIASLPTALDQWSRGGSSG